jgi:hypothetical protein
MRQKKTVITLEQKCTGTSTKKNCCLPGRIKFTLQERKVEAVSVVGHQTDGRGQEGEEADECGPHPVPEGRLVLQVVVAEAGEILHMGQDQLARAHREAEFVQHPATSGRFSRFELLR